MILIIAASLAIFASIAFGANAQTLENKGEPSFTSIVVSSCVDTIGEDGKISDNEQTPTTGTLNIYDLGFELTIGDSATFYMVKGVNRDKGLFLVDDLDGNEFIVGLEYVDDETKIFMVTDRITLWTYEIKRPPESERI